MRAMTKSAVRLARTALAVGEEALPRYASRYRRHDYTQAQLFALLVLEHFLRTDYRGVVTLAAEWAELRRALRLAQVPHYSTLCYAARRLDAATFAALQAACFRRARAGRGPAGGPPARAGDVARRRRLRRGAQPPPLPRAVHHHERDRAQRPQHGAALAARARAPCPAPPLPARAVPAQVARRECVLAPQAPPRLRPHGPAPARAAAGDAPARPHAQPDDAQAQLPKVSTEH